MMTFVQKFLLPHQRQNKDAADDNKKDKENDKNKIENKIENEKNNGYQWLNELDYSALLASDHWQNIHPAVRARFSNHKRDTIVYKGVMTKVYLSFAGKCFAQLCRLIGTPLALHAANNVPMRVNVYPNTQLKGICWERIYQYSHKAENKVSSCKCILPGVGLVERIGCGFGMKLKVGEEEGAITFNSEHYFLQIGPLFFRIPNWLTPGATKVSQRAIDNDWFEFRLDVIHPWLGSVFRQVGQFRKVEPVEK